MKLPKEIDLDRLCAAVQMGRRALEYPRRERTRSVREAAGDHHSEGGTGYPVPLNVIDTYERVVSRYLFGSNPRAMLVARDPRQESAVMAAEAWVNDEIERMDLAETLARIGVDALHMFGCAKIGLADPADAERRGWRLSAGVPFCDLVDPDDFVCDPFARTPAEFSFVGHRFRVPVRVAKKVYAKNRKTRDSMDVEESWGSDFNEQGDERIQVVGRGIARQAGEWEDRIDLWELYLSSYRLLITLFDDAARGSCSAEDPVRVAKWYGPPEGPYRIFGLGTVAGHWRPKAPIQNLMDLAVPMNRHFRKLNRQADRVKKVMPMRGDTKDYDRLSQTSDGFGFQCEQPEMMKELVVNEPVSSLHVFANWMHQMLNDQAGNLAALAGLGPQAGTAAQDRMIHQSSSEQIAGMQDKAVDFVADVLRRLLWLWWRHPQKVMKSRYAPEAMPELSRQLRVYPGHFPKTGIRGQPVRTRWGAMPDLRVDPYSLQHKTPQQRWAFIKATVEELMPIMPLLQQQGIQLDLQAYLRLGKKYNDEPDITTLFSIAEKPEPSPKGGSGAQPDVATPATDKTTTIVRKSQGDSSGQKRKADLAAELMGGRGGWNGSVNPSSNGSH